MINLAGHCRATEICTEELRRCEITVVPCEPKGEVATAVEGQLPGLRFQRAWYYWVVTGQVPLAIAKELYAHPVGKTDVRVAGHCMCPPPEDPWIEYYAENGQPVHSLVEKDEFERFAKEGKSSFIRDIGEKGLREYLFDDNRDHRYRACVELYHIDSELGLWLFVQHVLPRGLFRELQYLSEWRQDRGY